MVPLIPVPALRWVHRRAASSWGRLLAPGRGACCRCPWCCGRSPSSAETCEIWLSLFHTSMYFCTRIVVRPSSNVDSVFSPPRRPSVNSVGCGPHQTIAACQRNLGVCSLRTL